MKIISQMQLIRKRVFHILEEVDEWMKNLPEIQQDIRNLEKNITDIAASMKGILSDVEKLKNANWNTDVDYSTIEMLAKNFSFGRHPIGRLEDGGACCIYLEMLLNIVRLDLEGETSLNRLVFIQWIQQEAGIDRSLEDLHKGSYKIKADAYREMADAIPIKYKEYFIVDALIVANIEGNPNTEIYEYIAGLVSVLGIDKERLIMLSSIAKTALCQKIEPMRVEEFDKFQRFAKLYRHYLKDFDRKIVIKQADDDVRDFVWKVKQGQRVKKNDVIATYTYRRGLLSSTEEIKTPSAGTIFIFKDNHIFYGVLAHGSDNKASIKAWVKKRRNG